MISHNLLEHLFRLIGLLGFTTLIAWELIAGNPFGYQMVMTALAVGLSLLAIVLFGNF